MGIVGDQEHVIGQAEAFFFEPQTVLDTMVRPTASGAFNLLKLNTSFDQEREDRMDNRLSAGVSERISKMRKITLDGEGYLIPSGTAGTAPDVGELLQCLTGTETVSGGVSVAYTLSNSQAIQIGTLARIAYSGAASGVGIFMETLIGSWINEGKIAFTGSDAPKFSFSGGASRLIETYRAVLEDAISSSATMVLTTATRYAVETDSVIQIASDTNTNVGYRVTVDTANPSFTLQTTVTASDAAIVAPFAPAGTLTGSPIAGIAGSMTLGGTSVATIVGGEVVINNGLKPIEDQAFALHVPDVIKGKRVVSGNFTIRLRADQFAALGSRKKANFATQAIVIVLGSTAGSICTISMPYCELEFSAIDYPEGREEATVQIPFVARESTASSADAISITFT